MTRAIANLLLALVARNVQSILDFVTQIDARLDSYIAKQDRDEAAINAQIDALTDNRAGIRAARELAARVQTGVRQIGN